MQPEEIETTVLFDGSCPLCTAEINQYKLITPAGSIKWVDVSTPEFTAPAGLSREELMQRFHVIKPNGDLILCSEGKHKEERLFIYSWRK